MTFIPGNTILPDMRKVMEMFQPPEPMFNMLACTKALTNNLMSTVHGVNNGPFGIKIKTMDIPMRRVQVRFPRTNKRRIAKKWTKKECNYEYRHQAFLLNSQMSGACFQYVEKMKIQEEAEYKERFLGFVGGVDYGSGNSSLLAITNLG